MQKSIILIAVILVSFLNGKAQTWNNHHSQSFLSGKYELKLSDSTNPNGQALFLNGNLPGNVKIRMNLTITEPNGKTLQVEINKVSGAGTIELYTSKSGIQHIEVTSFRIQFNEFGETYGIQWDQDWQQLMVTKGGASYEYGSPYVLENSSYQMQPHFDTVSK